MGTHHLCFYEELGENYPRIVVKYTSSTAPLDIVLFSSVRVHSCCKICVYVLCRYDYCMAISNSCSILLSTNSAISYLDKK